MIKPSTTGISTSDVIVDVPPMPEKGNIKARVIVQCGETYVTFEADTVDALMELRRQWNEQNNRDAFES